MGIGGPKDHALPTDQSKSHDTMPELLAVTTAYPDESAHSIGARAAREFERFAQKGNSPYWDVTAASEAVDTVQKATPGGASPDGDPDDAALLVHEINSAEATELLDTAFETTTEQTRSQLADIGAALETVADATDIEDGESLVEAIAQDDEAVMELLAQDQFVYSAAEIGNRFGEIYRVFDLTDWKHGHPVRSRADIAEIRDRYADADQSVYVVKLLARTQ